MRHWKILGRNFERGVEEVELETGGQVDRTKGTRKEIGIGSPMCPKKQGQS